MGPDLESFRAEVRAFVTEHAPAIPRRAGVRSAENEAELNALKQWTARLFDAGYVGADWPAEFGGRDDRSAEHSVVVSEELARAGVPGVPSGSALASHALIHYGSDEQCRRHLPEIRSGRELWCQLFSEPGAGSDLASLRTRAVLDGDTYTVNGQKVWTTDGHWADYGYLLARTDFNAPKHRGISAFIVDMRNKGVTVRPLRELTGTSDFNEVFLDSVQVPAEAMIGSPGQGWVIANTTLAHERTSVGVAVVKLRLAIDGLVDLARRVAINAVDTSGGAEEPRASAAGVVRVIADAIAREASGLVLAAEPSTMSVAELQGTESPPKINRDEVPARELPATTIADGVGIPISMPAYARAFEPKIRWEAAVFDERPGIDPSPQFPPRVRVDNSGALATDYRLEPLPRTGTVYTHTTIRIPVPDLPSPYSLAVVQLDDSPVRVLMKVTGVPAGEATIGQAGSVVLRKIATRAGVPDYGYAFWPGRVKEGVRP